MRAFTIAAAVGLMCTLFERCPGGKRPEQMTKSGGLCLLFVVSLHWQKINDLSISKLKSDQYHGGIYSSGHLCQEDTSLLKTPIFSPNLVIYVKCNICNQDTFYVRAAILSPKVT
jgi:hypothetical protein